MRTITIRTTTANQVITKNSFLPAAELGGGGGVLVELGDVLMKTGGAVEAGGSRMGGETMSGWLAEIARIVAEGK